MDGWMDLYTSENFKYRRFCSPGGSVSLHFSFNLVTNKANIVKSQQYTHINTEPCCVMITRLREMPLISLRPCSYSFVSHFPALLCFGFSCFYWLTLLLSCHYFYLFPPLSLSLSFLIRPNSSLLPSADIVMLLHTTLSRLKRWSHEWSLQFKSTQPSRCLKWIFCIYSCNNDSIWGYYLQTVAEFSAALITEWRASITKMKNVFILTCLEWTSAIN